MKVSKIINLSEDIARNTSSESARISTIPGRNTIGIELPNITRENVYLSEVIKDAQFKKKDINQIPDTLDQEILPEIKDKIGKTNVINKEFNIKNIHRAVGVWGLS